MKNIILSGLVILALCSCEGNKSVNKICGFIENATEQVENATTLKEIEDINSKLTQNIAIYSLSLTNEEYEEWANDPEANKIIQEAQYKYKTAQKEREAVLKGK